MCVFQCWLLDKKRIGGENVPLHNGDGCEGEDVPLLACIVLVFYGGDEMTLAI